MAYLSGACGTISNVAGFPSVLNIFAIRLGLSNFLIGVLTFSMRVGVLARLVAAPWADRYSKVKIMSWLYTCSALMLVLVSMVPLAAARYPHARFVPVLFIFLLFLVRACVNGGAAAWMPLVKEIIPPPLVARFFARLRAMLHGFRLVILIVLAFFLGSNPEYWRFQVIFIVAAVFCLGRVIFISRIRPPRPAPPKPRKWLGSFAQPLSRPDFRRFLAYSVTRTFFGSLSAGYGIVFLKRGLGEAESTVFLYSCLASLASIISLAAWARLARAKGDRYVLALTSIGLCLSALLWPLVSTTDWTCRALVMTIFFLNGVLTAGSGIAMTTTLFGLTPRRTAAGAMALCQAVVHSAGAVAPLLGGTFLALCENASPRILGLELDVYRVLFLIQAIAFLPSLPLLRSCVPTRRRPS